MADIVFNESLGKVNEWPDRVDGNDPSTAEIALRLLSAVDADNTIRDVDTAAALLALGGTTETNATNYAAKALSDTDIGGSSVNDTTNVRAWDVADQLFSALGGAANTALAAAVWLYDALGTAVDANQIPIVKQDFVLASTNGGDVTLQVDSNGVWSASSAA